MELVADLRSLAGRNRSADDLVCFAGGGAYDHYVPSVVWAMAGRSEFYTSYTPVPAGAVAGCAAGAVRVPVDDLRAHGLEVSNASLYDGATALVEAVHMTVDRGPFAGARVGRRRPARRRGAAHGGRGSGVRRSSRFDGAPEVGDDVAAVVVQHPNVYGVLEPAQGAASRRRARGGATAIQVFDPLSLGVLASPGELGADIAVGEGQVLGNHLNYGGPYLGIIAARLADVRKLPGRIVGETADVDGRTGYVLTLQAREQHIRRDKANSNICTNQTLMAIAAAVYLAWLGPEGLAELGRQCHVEDRVPGARRSQRSPASSRRSPARRASRRSPCACRPAPST